MVKAVVKKVVMVEEKKRKKNNAIRGDKMKKVTIIGILMVLCLSIAYATGPKEMQDTAGPQPELISVEMGQAGSGEGQGMAEEKGNEETGGEGAGQETETETKEQNQGEETKIQNKVQVQTKLMSGEHIVGEGKKIMVSEQAANRMQIKAGDVAAETGMELMQEQNAGKVMLKTKLSNGKDAEIKIMPDSASEKALERLRMKVCSEENGCQIELKEVGSGEQVRAAYEVRAQKESKVLGMFKTRMRVSAEVDAETGEVIDSKKPWWAFLASEKDETEE